MSLENINRAVRFGNYIDLGQEYRPDELTDEKVVGAIWDERKTKNAIIIPDSYQFWDPSKVVRTYQGEIPLDSPDRERKFGDEVNVNRSGMSIREARNFNLLKDIYVVLTDPKTAEKLLHGSTRGIGYWSPRTRLSQHRIILWNTMLEGEGGYRALHNRIKGYEKGDSIIQVPSLTRNKVYTVSLTPLPITEDDSIFRVELLQMRASCQCEDYMYRERRGKRREDERKDEKWLNTYKYAAGEVPFCKHTYMAFRKAMEDSLQDEEIPTVLASPFPVPTNPDGLNFQVALEQRIVIGNPRKKRRPLKTEQIILIGRTAGYLALKDSQLDRLFIFD
jgi:hypothetical protein